MGTPLISENFPDLLEPGLRQIFDDVYKTLPDMLPSLYRMGTASTSYEKTSSVGAFGDFTNFDDLGQIAYDDISQGYDTKIEFTQWVSGCQVERKLFDKLVIVELKPNYIGETLCN